MERPAHADLDGRGVGVDLDVREPTSGAEQAEEPSDPTVVAELEPAHEDTVPPLRARWLWLLGAVVAAGRYWFSSNRDMFHMAPDEAAQLAMARWISGGPRWNLFDHSTWRPGMAILMAPIYWFSSNTTTIYHGGLMIGAALGGIAAVQLARLGQRVAGLSPVAAWFAAAAVASTAQSLSATSFVWAEGLVTATFLATTWYVLRYYDTGAVRHGALACVWVAAGLVSHSRLLPLVPIVVLLVIGRALLRREWAAAGRLAGAAAAANGAAIAFSHVVYEAVWDRPGSTNSIGTVFKRLPRITDEARSTLGQTWYQLAATAGLVMAGLVVAAVAAVRRSPASAAPRSRPSVRDARLLLALIVPMVGVSIVFMSSRTRIDHRIYGRYNDAIVWPLLVLGIAWLLGIRRERRVVRSSVAVVVLAGAIVGAGYAVRAVMGTALEEGVGVRPMIAGFMPVTGTGRELDVLRLSFAGAILLGALAVAAMVDRRGRVLLLVGAAYLVVGGFRTHDSLGLRLNSWQPATEVVAIDDIVPPDATLGVKFVRDRDDPSVSWDDQRRRAQLYQFALPDHPFVRDRGLDDSVGPLVFAPSNDLEMIEAGAVKLWTDPKVSFSLWREPAGTG